MAQHLVGHLLRQQTEKDRVVPRFPQRLARLGQRTHQSLRMRARQRFRHDGITLILDQMAQLGRADLPGGLTAERDRRRVTARRGIRARLP